MSKAWDITAQVITNLLLFLLVMGMASTVDIRNMKKQLRNWKAIGTGMFCQFVLLPFIGWSVVMMFNLPPPIGVTLLVVVSSPGGSYSNWWCSLLNADLALSVSMTAMSTIISAGMLPLNLLIYTHAAYSDSTTSSGEDILSILNFGVIFISIGVVIGAILFGMYASAKFDSPRFHKFAYIGGNISGISLIVFSTVLSFVGGGNDDTQSVDLTEGSQDDALIYFAIVLPCLIGLLASTIIATLCRLTKPERLTTGVECSYQNTGIATSAALSLFSGPALNQAMRVPFIYGLAEALFICVYLLVFWKLGWSKAPRNEKCCKVITSTYEIHKEEDEDDENADSSRPKDGEANSEEMLDSSSEELTPAPTRSDDFIENADPV